MIACGWQVLSNSELRSRARADPLQKPAERQRALKLIEHELDMALKYPTPHKPATRMPANLGSAR